LDYYQVRLTRLLETEQYREAAELLRFLLDCKHDDGRSYEEWRSLLEWLESVSPAGNDKFDVHAETDEDVSEADMLRDRMRQKTEQDQEYAKKLLDILLQDQPHEHKLLALDQLAYIDHPQINDTLVRWLRHVELHPLVQFKVLQTLKQRGYSGMVKLVRNAEAVELRVEDTPLSFAEIPEPIIQVAERVKQASEVNHPMLSYFAEELWREFVLTIYGNAVYHSLLNEDRIDVWAAALHQISLEATGMQSEESPSESYPIDDSQLFRYEQALRILRNYAGANYDHL
jgi:hypothetical protein